MTSFFRMLSLVLVALLPAACASVPTPEVPDLAYTDQTPIALSADRRIEIVEEYRPPLSKPHVEHEFRVVPAQIARAWARDRLALSGSGGDVKLTIIDAGVVEEKLEGGGIGGFLFGAPDRKLTATLRARLDYVGVRGAASATATATVSREIPEGASLNEVEAIYFDMLRALKTEFDRALSEQVELRFRPVFGGAA